MKRSIYVIIVNFMLPGIVVFSWIIYFLLYHMLDEMTPGGKFTRIEYVICRSCQECNQPL